MLHHTGGSGKLTGEMCTEQGTWITYCVRMSVPVHVHKVGGNLLWHGGAMRTITVHAHSPVPQLHAMWRHLK